MAFVYFSHVTPVLSEGGFSVTEGDRMLIVFVRYFIRKFSRANNVSCNPSIMIFSLKRRVT